MYFHSLSIDASGTSSPRNSSVIFRLPKNTRLPRSPSVFVGLPESRNSIRLSKASRTPFYKNYPRLARAHSVCPLCPGEPCFVRSDAILRLCSWQCKRTSTVVAASTVVDIASVDIAGTDLWEPFRMYLLMKEVGFWTAFECSLARGCAPRMWQWRSISMLQSRQEVMET